MNDDENRGIRRVTRKDRKKKLDTRGPLFPPDDFEDVPAEAESSVAEPENLPFPPLVVTPDADRFPPLDTGGSKPPTPAKRTAKPRRRLLPNLVALLFAVATVALLAVYIIIAVDPYTPLNPLPPFTPFPIIITTTPLPPTATLFPTAGPTATFTPLPPDQLQRDLPFPFQMAASGIIYVPNAGEKGCNWLSIAGSVTDTAGQPVAGLGVRVQGNGLDETVGTGGALNYGPGGFEMPLGEAPGIGTYTVQLLSIQGAPLSEVYTVATRDTCDQNVAIISFVQVRGY
ncbi:MAG: hypothetical protein H6672_20120 [Anaerolineaceae bacterium]|nr:hypothetical protein [Anaerolineaceae bacterium]